MCFVNEGKNGTIQSCYSSNSVICLVTFNVIAISFIAFIFTFITIVSTNCKLLRHSDVQDCM